MKAHKGFNSIVIDKNDFKVAKSKTPPPATEWKPKAHMYADRMAEQRKVHSLWTQTLPKDFRK